MLDLRVQDFRRRALKGGVMTVIIFMKALTTTATVCGLVATICTTLGRSIELAYSLKEGK